MRYAPPPPEEVLEGTGITPIYQVLQAAAADADDRTRISLVYCNKARRSMTGALNARAC